MACPIEEKAQQSSTWVGALDIMTWQKQLSQYLYFFSFLFFSLLMNAWEKSDS